MREGDVYHWYYKNDLEYRKEKNLSGTAYWCMDNKCVFTGGNLFDTYWCYNLETFDSSCNRVKPDEIDLEFICNLSDVDLIQKWEVEDYDKVYNLSYQKGCYEKYAVDKGVGKSKVAIRNKLLKQIEKNRVEMESCKRDWLSGTATRGFGRVIKYRVQYFETGRGCNPAPYNTDYDTQIQAHSAYRSAMDRYMENKDTSSYYIKPVYIGEVDV